MNGLINKGVSSALARVFSRRAAILKIAEEKTLGTRLGFVGLERILEGEIRVSGLSLY